MTAVVRMAAFASLMLGLGLVSAAPAHLKASAPQQAAPPLRCIDKHPDDVNASLTAIEKNFAGDRAPFIFRALGKDQHAALKKMLAGGANPNVCYGGFSPLMGAVASGDAATVAILLAGGAQPDRPLDPSGSSVLHSALSLGQFVIAGLLLDHGADPSLRDDDGGTALFELATAATKDKPVLRALQIALAKRLITPKFGVDATGPRHSTPLMSAVSQGNVELVEFLLKEGANPTLRNKEGKSAIDIARERTNTGLVALLERCVAQDRDGTRLQAPCSMQTQTTRPAGGTNIAE